MSRLRGRASKTVSNDMAPLANIVTAINRTWNQNAHCLRLGCGQETFSYWVRDSNHGAFWSPKVLRRTLLCLVRDGHYGMEAAPGKYTRFYRRES